LEQSVQRTWCLARLIRKQECEGQRLFKSSNPEKGRQLDVDAATENRERLGAQLAETEQAVTRHAAAAKLRQGELKA